MASIQSFVARLCCRNWRWETDYLSLAVAKLTHDYVLTSHKKDINLTNRYENCFAYTHFSEI